MLRELALASFTLLTIEVTACLLRTTEAGAVADFGAADAGQ